MCSAALLCAVQQSVINRAADAGVVTMVMALMLQGQVFAHACMHCLLFLHAHEADSRIISNNIMIKRESDYMLAILFVFHHSI